MPYGILATLAGTIMPIPPLVVEVRRECELAYRLRTRQLLAYR